MKKGNYIVLVALFALLVLCPVKSMAQNSPPVADAGLSRYAAQNLIVLDGTDSFDPDNSGTLSYTWQQISGPSVVIADTSTATPTISGFIQTDAIQECEFELVVSDGELTSLPDTVKVIIVPNFGATTLQQENPPFDPDKSTVIYFRGAGCVIGGGSWASPSWAEKANIISFPSYEPDSDARPTTYYHYGDMIIVYLSSVAPDYKQPIQAMGFSGGGDPAMDVGIHLNRVYRDARYAVNRVTEIDAGCRINLYGWDFYRDIGELFLTSAVDGEQCWFDNYYGSRTHYALGDLLAVSMGLSHWGVQNWYRNSLTRNDMNNFNSGVVAGAYWSVIGPGKNLQLARQTDAYYFWWDGNEQSGGMSFFLQSQHPGRLPEPVTLVGPLDVGDPNGAILTCEESENAVGYQLLFGPDPYRVMDYNIISDTPTPPNEVITTLPFEETWWTVKVRDQYGSTIYADPVYINAFILSLPVENLTTGKRYAYIQAAITEALPSDEIVASPGIYQENIDFKGKNLTVRSTDPNDLAVVADTVINGNGLGSVVTFASGEDANCIFAGFTITGGNTENGGGIYCGNNSTPTMTNCIITNNSAIQGGGGVYTDNSSPTMLNCIVSGNSAKVGGGLHCGSGSATMVNCTFVRNTALWAGGLFNFGGGPVVNCIFWDNSSQQIADTQGTFSVTYSNVQGGWPGEGNIDTDPLFADTDNGDYHLKSQAGRWDSNTQTWVVDDVTSSCIDAGDPGTPVGLEPLPNGGIINMGAYGGTDEASKSPTN